MGSKNIAKIQVNPNWTTVTGVYGEVLTQLCSTLTVKQPNYWFSTAYKEKRWDGNIKFYGMKNSAFFVPTGFLGIVTRVLRKNNFPYNIDNPYLFKEEACFEDVELKGIELRDYQIQTLYEMHRLGRGIIKGQTGSGKTECALAFTKWYLDNYNGIVLFLTHRKSIFSQVWMERLQKRLKIHPIESTFDSDFASDQIVYNVYNNDENKIIVIAMSQTFSSHIKEFGWLNDVRVVFCDECHAIETHSRKSGKRKVQILNELRRCYHRFGMSATPFKKEGSKDEFFHKYKTMTNFGDVVEIQHEQNVKCVVNMLPLDYEKSRSYEEALEMSQNNMEKAEEIRKIIVDNRDKKILVFSQFVEHGNILSEYLGVPFLYGETPSQERIDICNDFRIGMYSCLIVSRIFYFGIDIPEVDCIIFANIGKSYINVIQSLGRGMRELEGKKELVAYDFYEKDNSYLEKHSLDRIKHYKSMKYTVRSVL